MRIVPGLFVLMLITAAQGAEGVSNEIEAGIFDGEDGVLEIKNADGVRVSASRQLTGDWALTASFSRFKASGNEAELSPGICTGICFGFSYDVDHTAIDAKHNVYALGIARTWDIADNVTFLLGISAIRDSARIDSSTTRVHYENVTQPVRGPEDLSGTAATSITPESRQETRWAETGWQINAGVRHSPFRVVEFHANATLFERLNESGHGFEVGADWLMAERIAAGVTIFTGDELSGWQVSGRWQF